MLLWIDGFDNYGTTPGAAPSPTGVVGRKYPLSDRENAMDIAAGRFGGYALQLVYDSTCYASPGPLTTDGTVVLGCSIKIPGYPGSGQRFLSLYDGTTLGVNLAFGYGGSLLVQRGTTLLETVTSPFSLNTWTFIELKVTCHSSAGAYEVRLNGETIASATGVNTQAGSNAYHTTFRLTGHSTSPTTSVLYDDLYFLDSTSAVNNNFLGLQKVVTLYPSGAGSDAEWDGSAGGDHYTYVDEAVSDDDTTYVESDTSTEKELWAYDDASDLGLVAGLQVNTECRETDATAFSLVTVVKTASESDDTAQAVGSSDYVSRYRLLETDPHDSAAWNVSRINSAQFGVKVD